MKKEEAFDRFLTFARLAVSVAEMANVPWHIKFELIFSESIKGEIDNTGICIEWCDPDTTYQEDVCAYIEALKKKLNVLEEAISGHCRKALQIDIYEDGYINIPKEYYCSCCHRYKISKDLASSIGCRWLVSVSYCKCGV